jgi:uncharacterized membrane protein YbhN (UPF0104 family)
MTSTRTRWVLGIVVLASAPFAFHFLLRFPWSHTLDAIADADWLLLGLAAVMNLASLVAKGWAWHLLLRPAAPHRWRTAQRATFVGAAVNAVSISVSGEAARLQTLMAGDAMPIGSALASLIWSRIVEAMALVLFLGVALLALPPMGLTKGLEIAVWGLIVVSVVGWRLGAWPRLVSRLPERWRARVDIPGAPGGRGHLVAPLALSSLNWVAQWLSYHWVIAATHVSTSPAVSGAALLMANIGGILRVTPGNVGVLQASLVLGMLAFNIPSDQALAAGLVLQAVQTLPVLGIGVALAGLEGFRRMFAKRTGAIGTA